MRSSIAKVVNPLGTVTTIVEHDGQLDADEFAEEYSSGAYLHENCDESMFRPYVAVISGSIDDGIGGKVARNEKSVNQEKPEPIGQKLIVPVIDSVQLERQKREKSRQLEMKKQRQSDEAKRKQDEENVAKFEQMSLLNRKEKSKPDSKVEDKAPKKISDEKKSLPAPKIVMASKEMERSSEEKRTESIPKSEKKGKIDAETVTVKLRKKQNKGQTNKSIEPSPECDEESQKKTDSIVIVAAVDDLSEQKSDSDLIEGFVAPKPVKTKKERKASMESGSSKESSMEKDLVMMTAAMDSMTVAASSQAVETSKAKRKKQRKIELAAAAAAAAAAISTSSSDDAKGGSASESQMDRSDSMGRNPFLMEDIERIDGAQCAEIQQSLLKTSVTATVSIRKGSMQGKQQSHRETDDGDALPGSSGKSGRKKEKKWSKESIESEATTSNNSPSCNAMDEFTYPDPSELTDADNLSFKSIIDDHITVIPLESIANEDDVEWPTMAQESKVDAAVASEYDKLSDEAEASSGTQYADCKSFQLIIDESEAYMRTADTNSSDETEDTKSTSEKVLVVDDNDDEDLQPLIQSTTSDSAAAAVNLSVNTLPNQSDSTPLAPEPEPELVAETTTASEPSQSQTQKQTGGGGGNNSNNKKRLRKKRR